MWQNLKIYVWLNSNNQIETRLKNSNCGNKNSTTWIVKKKSKTKTVIKRRRKKNKSTCHRTKTIKWMMTKLKKIKFWQNSTTKIVKKLKNWNGDKTKKN